MLCFLNLALTLCTILFPLQASAAEDDGDDFSNNLFSDLAPILALFGEQVAKQFMSQSMGWADNVIFAMAPLGIITAIVGAIRVGGPVWLKAIIGRARENRAAAEVELMSSTSPDVCELWNGQTIVRMMGSPPIVQIIHFHEAVGESNERIFTLEEAIDQGLIEPEENHSFLQIFESIVTDKLRAEPDEGMAEKDEETRLKQHPKEQTSPPNILFNVRPAKSRLRLYFTAVVGVLLQFGVLVFSGFATHYPTLAFKKGDSSVIGYAYPLTASGTLILVLGMLLCSFVVEQFTHEETWKTKGGRKFDLMWLQQEREVNDQMFDSYAIFALESRESILTSRSHRHPKPRSVPTDTTKYRIAELLYRISRPFLQFLSKGNHNPALSLAIFKILVISGTMISICGFVVQFIGLRGMHWSATIAQLSATLIMVALRAWVRWDLASRPHSQRVAPGHELDWLATRIAREPKGPCADTGLWAKPDSNDPFWTSECWLWEVMTGGDVKGYEIRNLHDDRTENAEGRTDDAEGPTAFAEDPTADNEDSTDNEDPTADSEDPTADSEDPTADSEDPTSNRKGLRADRDDPTADGEDLLADAEGPTTVAEDPTADSEGSTDNEDPMADSEDPTADSDDFIIDGEDLIADAEGPTAVAEDPTTDSENPTANGKELTGRDDPMADGENLTADKVVKARQRLGILSHWPSKASQPAISVAITIEAVMNNLFTGTYNKIELDSLIWSMDGLVDRKSRKIFFSLRKNNNRWTADATEIEAALSLWLYSVRERERTEATGRNDSKDVFQNPQENGTRDWLRLGNAALRKENIRLLGASTPASRRDLTWYLGEKANMISIVQEDGSDGNSTSDIIIIESQRVVGVRGKPATDSFNAKTIFKRSDRSILEFGIEEESNPPSAEEYLAVVSDTPLEMLLAQEMFSAFMWGFAKEVSRIEGDSKVHQNDTKFASGAKNWQNIRLDNSKLLRVAEAFQEAGLGSIEEAYSTIIPPLSLQEKLPVALTVVEYAQGIAQEAEAAGQWELASHIYLWLFEVGKTFTAPDPVVVKATAILTEFSSLVECMLEESEAQKRNADTSKMLADLKNDLSKALETADNSIRDVLQLMYVIQHRDKKGKHMNPGPDSQEITTALDSLARLDYSGLTSLHRAVFSSDSTWILRNILGNGADRNCQDILGWTALHYSALLPESTAAGVLLSKATISKSINPSLRTLAGWTSLHLTAYKNSCTVGWMLLDNNYELEIQGRDGMRPLHIAVREGSEEMVGWLLDAGAEIDARDSARRTPLHWAAYSGNSTMVALLKKKGANHVSRDDNGRVPLHLAAIARYTASLEDLAEDETIEANDRTQSTPLLLGAMMGAEDLVRNILQRKVNVDKEDRYHQTPLSHAAQNGHINVVELLIEKDADVNSKDWPSQTSLSYAAQNGHINVVELLIEKDADVNSKDWRNQTPLSHAARNGHINVVELLRRTRT